MVRVFPNESRFSTSLICRTSLSKRVFVFRRTRFLNEPRFKKEDRFLNESRLRGRSSSHFIETIFFRLSRLVSQKRWVIPFIKSRFSLTCLVSETSNRDRWERVSISRFRFDCRKRNREAIKSRRFLSSTLRYVAQKQWVIHCFYALPDFLERFLRFWIIYE